MDAAPLRDAPQLPFETPVARPPVVRKMPVAPPLALVEIERRPGGPVVVLDTNVLLSALFARPGQCAAIVRRGASGEFRLTASQQLWNELRVLLGGTYAVEDAEVEQWLQILGAPFDMIQGAMPRVRQGGRALSDGARRALDTAVSARATFLVTSDPELLRISLVQGVEILSPQAFAALQGE